LVGQLNILNDTLNDNSENFQNLLLSGKSILDDNIFHLENLMLFFENINMNI
jgi:hypothetical protein